MTSTWKNYKWYLSWQACREPQRAAVGLKAYGWTAAGRPPVWSHHSWDPITANSRFRLETNSQEQSALLLFIAPCQVFLFPPCLSSTSPFLPGNLLNSDLFSHLFRLLSDTRLCNLYVVPMNDFTWKKWESTGKVFFSSLVTRSTPVPISLLCFPSVTKRCLLFF